MKEGLTKRAQEKPEVALKIDYIDSVGRERAVERCRHYGPRRLEDVVRLLVSTYSNDTLPLNIAMQIVETFNLNEDLRSDVRTDTHTYIHTHVDVHEVLFSYCLTLMFDSGGSRAASSKNTCHGQARQMADRSAGS
jgi:hypothetical protein